jgi:cysteine desulfurase
VSIYLDNNATTPLSSAVIGCIEELLVSSPLNASSVHLGGRVCRELIEQARHEVAAMIGAENDQIVFTSGATEANNHVFRSIADRSESPCKVITTVVEHSSIVNTCEMLRHKGHRVEAIPVLSTGLVDMGRFAASLNDGADLVSIQWVNNETGIIQPVLKIAEMCREHGVMFHTDAAQAVGKFEIKATDMPIDLLSLSGHKLHAPQGVGALYVRDGLEISPLLFGGAQEGGRRAGTENVLGILALGTACRERGNSLVDFFQKTSMLRDSFEAQIQKELDGIIINGDQALRVCNSTNIQFSGTNGEALVAQLDGAGLMCSQSSACTSGRPEPSYVLRAMGLSEQEAYDSVRFSFSALNNAGEVDDAVKLIVERVKRLRTIFGYTNANAQEAMT